MRVLQILIAISAVVAIGACGTMKHVVSGGCPREWRPLAVINRALEVVPGEKRALGRPYIFDGPFGMKDLPKGCNVAWAVRGGAATVDGRGNLAVRADAAPGTTFDVLAYTAGVWGRQTAFVVDPRPNPIAGTWSQRGEGTCRDNVPAEPRIGELIFQRNGQYALTRQPFETQYDYWGTYTYDAATGRLSLSQPGSQPNREYHATLNARGELVIEGFGGAPAAGCTATFENSGTTYRP